MPEVFGYLFAVLIGYLLGCSNLAFFLARSRGVDILHLGTCNPGTSNAMILMGWKAGVLVGIHDIGKGLLAVLLCGLLFPALPYCREIAGFCCVIGHLYPFYLRFRGGKGFATYLGVVGGLDIRFALILGAVIILLVLITDYMVSGTLATVISSPIYFLVTKWYAAAAMLAVLTAIILYKHRENFVRILKGTEIGLRRANRGELRADRPNNESPPEE